MSTCSSAQASCDSLMPKPHAKAMCQRPCMCQSHVPKAVPKAMFQSLVPKSYVKAMCQRPCAKVMCQGHVPKPCAKGHVPKASCHVVLTPSSKWEKNYLIHHGMIEYLRTVVSSRLVRQSRTRPRKERVRGSADSK